MRGTCVTILCVGLVFSVPATSLWAAGSRPNFIFILADDLGWKDLGCYGSPFYQTPHLDRLAGQGMRFTQAYAACSVCSPTRASILTGRHPARLHLTDWLPGRPDRPDQKLNRPAILQHLPLEEVTLAEALKQAGYRTASIGKWHLGDQEYFPERQGFDLNVAGCQRGHPPSYFSPYGIPTLTDGPKGEYLTDRLTDEAIRFIEAAKGQPFLLYLSHYAVHTPLQARQDLIAKYKAKAGGLSAAGPEFAMDRGRQVRQIQNHPVYASMVEGLDASVGRILDTLVDLGLDQNTVIVFTSDNGGLSTAEGTPTSNAPLRMGKGWNYEGGVRVPLLIRCPGVTRPGGVCDSPVISMDYYPTLLEMAGLALRPERHVDGVSLVPLLKGGTPVDRPLFWHYPHYSNQGGSPSGAVRVGDYKLIEWFEDTQCQLFNLKDDPGERQDLASQTPEKAAALRQHLHEWRTAVGAQMPTRNPDYRPATARPGAADPPNILWITCEDINPHLGCYGDAYADTPHLDRFSTQALRYTHCWSTAPVCAPARTCIITGVYAPSLGAEHMRSEVAMPRWMKMAPQFLRERGYYCTNNNKEDYNVTKPAGVWDDSSAKAHWKNRRPGQPFFAVFNIEVSHESRIRARPHTLTHDPAKAMLPAYHPDTPEVRRDWAQYYDQITEMDRLFGQRLQELKEAGLMEDTIVFFYGDNGSGMPRSKRCPYNSGLNVPLIVYVPEKFRSLSPHGYAAGGVSDRLVGFVDLAPTLLGIVGIKAPEWMQGHAFMGPSASPASAYAFGFRGRMDERCDMIRSVRNQRYVYVRNYMPHLIYGQYIEYMSQTPTTRVWKALYDQGRLRPPQTAFWQAKPPEELYDLQLDASEVNNLVGSAQHQAVLAELRLALRQHILTTRDLGFLSEAEQHSLAAETPMYEMGHDPARYPLERILQAADAASLLKVEDLPALRQHLKDPDNAVRYWAAMGLLMRGSDGAAAAATDLRAALKDPSPSVRIVAAQALGQYGRAMDLSDSLSVLGELAPPSRSGMYVSILALNAIEAMGTKALPLMDRIRAMPTQDPGVVKRAADYAGRLQADILRRYRENPSASPMMWSDSSRMGRPFAKDPSVIRWAGRYLLYYSLPPSEDPSMPPGWAIGIAESNDLSSWRRIGQLGPEQDCDRKGLAAPCAIVLKDRVHLFYQTYGNGARDALCHAVSEDGVAFIRDSTNPVFHPTGDWTCGRAIDAEVVPFGDRLLLLCATRDPQMRTQMITGAWAPLDSDFSRPCWQQIGDGPLLRPELAWERSCIEAPSVMARQGRLFMFYAGAYNNEPQQIGVAASDDGLHWKRLSDQPLLPNGEPGEWNSSESGHPGVFVDGDGQTHLFFQGNNDKGHTWFLSRMKVEWEQAGPYLVRPGDAHESHLR